jgi:hypothetical protein
VITEWEKKNKTEKLKKLKTENWNLTKIRIPNLLHTKIKIWFYEMYQNHFSSQFFFDS